MIDQEGMRSSPTIDDVRIDAVCNEQESGFARVKRMFTDGPSSRPRTPVTFDEAKLKCKARKRKERQESVSSISQERKVIRSNSEERPLQLTTHDDKKDIRRVSSHEDFQKAKNNRNIETVSNEDSKSFARQSPQRNIYLEVLGYDDCEHERRRSHERFARPLAQRGRRINIGRKCKAKQFSKSHVHKDNYDIPKENGIKYAATMCQIETEHQQVEHKHEEIESDVKTERSPSPENSPTSPALDLSTLHQQVDCCEPLLSSSSQQITEQTETLPSLSVASNRMLSSPRNSIMITRRIYLEPVVPQNNSILSKEPKNPLEQRVRQLSKQINSLKKKLKLHDDEFQTKFGYKPSHADKMNDKNTKKLCVDMNKLKKEYKQLKDDLESSTSSGLLTEVSSKEGQNNDQNLQNTLTEIEKRLREKRLTANRSSNMEDMNSEEVGEEKVAVQKALLYLESMHGRPSSKEDRDLVRPLYDRYRTLKRMMAKITMSSSTINELATIHEYETMDFVSSPPQTVENETDKINPSASTDSDTDISIGENLHTLTLDELIEQQKSTSEEKKQLRRCLKEFESDFQLKTGRKIQKDDRLPMTNIYTSYKQAKAKLRLLDALVGKQLN